MVYSGKNLTLERHIMQNYGHNYNVRNKFNARTCMASLNGRRGFNNRDIPVKGVEDIRFTGNSYTM